MRKIAVVALLFALCALSANPVPAEELSALDYYKSGWYCREAGDFSLGIKHMRKAYELGQTDALVEVAAWYLAGFAEVPEGESLVGKVTELMDLALEEGSAMAAYYWGLIYGGDPIPGDAFNGFIVSDSVIPRDMDKSVSYYQLALSMGYTKAYRYLGHIYYYGKNGALVDYAKAAEYYAQGAAAGDITCSHLYADCLYSGIGVERDAEGAIALYQALVDAKPSNHDDYRSALYMLGKVYDEGVFRERDEQLAQRYYELAASLGSKDAEEALAH